MGYKTRQGFLVGAWFIAFSFLIDRPAAAHFNRLIPPDEKGSYDVGYTTYCDTMVNGRVARITVYYPIPHASNDRDCPDTYDIYPPVNQANPATSCEPAPLYQVTSPLCAEADLPLAKGKFPLVIHDHGGPVAGADHQRVAYVPVNEMLASHGFIVVAALHSGNTVDRVLDLSLHVDKMLARNATPGDLFYKKIDPDRIGISGHSAGGFSALQRVTGIPANAVEIDTRFKAMILMEQGPPLDADEENVTIPYLLMGGSQHYSAPLLPQFFENTAQAFPRIYVRSPGALHLEYSTGICLIIDAAREAALTANPQQPEPLTNLITNPNTGLRSCNAAALSPAAATACNLWNMGEFQFPAAGPGFGGGRNFCDRTGVDSIVPLDLNPVDGFTDSPPFIEDDEFNTGPGIPEEEMTPVVTLYTVAFWETFLNRDVRYAFYLSPLYARLADLDVAVDVRTRLKPGK